MKSYLFSLLPYYFTLLWDLAEALHTQAIRRVCIFLVFTLREEINGESRKLINILAERYLCALVHVCMETGEGNFAQIH